MSYRENLLKHIRSIWFYSVPQWPQDLNAIEELNGINLSWEPPRFPSFSRIINYKIQRICGRHKETTIFVPVEKLSYLISDVFPSETYSFAIKSSCSTLDNTCDSELSHLIKWNTKSKWTLLFQFNCWNVLKHITLILIIALLICFWKCVSMNFKLSFCRNITCTKKNDLILITGKSFVSIYVACTYYIQ